MDHIYGEFYALWVLKKKTPKFSYKKITAFLIVKGQQW